MTNILITGGTGLIGRQLCKSLPSKGYQVGILSRTNKTYSGIQTYLWNPDKGEIDGQALRWADYVIHLAGENIGEKRWTKERKQLIIDSRVKSGQLLFNKLQQSEHKLKAFISASATGYYGSVNSEKTFSETDASGKDFTANVCRHWEDTAGKFNESGIRTVVIRTGVVLTKKGGALQKMMAPVRAGFGSALGNGKQFMPWIHIDDLCGIYIQAIENEQMQGVYNAVASEHITNTSFMRCLAKTMKKPYFFPNVPAFLLRLIFGEMSVILLKGSKVSSDKIRNSGFTFKFSSLEPALKDLI